MRRRALAYRPKNDTSKSRATRCANLAVGTVAASRGRCLATSVAEGGEGMHEGWRSGGKLRRRRVGEGGSARPASKCHASRNIARRKAVRSKGKYQNHRYHHCTPENNLTPRSAEHQPVVCQEAATKIDSRRGRLARSVSAKQPQLMSAKPAAATKLAKCCAALGRILRLTQIWRQSASAREIISVS